MFLFESLDMGVPISLDQCFPKLISVEYQFCDEFMRRGPPDKFWTCCLSKVSHFFC